MAASDNISRGQIPGHHIDAIRAAIDRLGVDHDTMLEPNPGNTPGVTLNVSGRRVPSEGFTDMVIDLSENSPRGVKQGVQYRLEHSPMNEHRDAVSPGSITLQNPDRKIGSSSWPGTGAYGWGPSVEGRGILPQVPSSATGTAKEVVNETIDEMSKDLDKARTRGPQISELLTHKPRPGFPVSIYADDHEGGLSPAGSYFYDPRTGNIS